MRRQIAGFIGNKKGFFFMHYLYIHINRGFGVNKRIRYNIVYSQKIIGCCCLAVDRHLPASNFQLPFFAGLILEALGVEIQQAPAGKQR